MNSSVYIFGNFSSGYSQYPDEEYTEAIFRQFSEKSKSPTQVTIHRDGHLMYYSYIRKLQEEGKYIGLCVLLNNGLFTDLKALFSVFENVFTNLVEQGYLVGFNEEGLLIPLVEKLYLSSDEVYAVATSLKGAINNIPSTPLPPENYNTSSSSSAEFTIADNMDSVVKSSYTNAYTYLYKDKSYNTARLNSYKGIVNKMKSERDDYERRYKELSSDLSRVKAQQGMAKWGPLLGAIILILGFVLWNKVFSPSEDRQPESKVLVAKKAQPQPQPQPQPQDTRVVPPEEMIIHTDQDDYAESSQSASSQSTESQTQQEPPKQEEHVQQTVPEEIKPREESPKVAVYYVVKKNMFVRTGPGLDYEPLWSPYNDFDSNHTNGVVVYKGTRLRAIEEANGFVHAIQLTPNNDRDEWGEGWISKKFLVRE